MSTPPPPSPPYTADGKLLKVRTVTTFVTLSRGTPLDLSPIVKAVSFNAAATERLTAEGFEVQTTRVATNSFEDYIDVSDSAAALQSFRAIDDECKRLSIRLFNVGPARTAEGIALVPDIIKLGPRLSASGVIPDALDAQAAARLADTVLRIAAETEGGEGNFQFCVSCNVGPHTPFFPASYSGGGPISFGCNSTRLWQGLVGPSRVLMVPEPCVHVV